MAGPQAAASLHEVTPPFFGSEVAAVPVKTLKALELKARLSELGDAAVCILIGDDDALRGHCLSMLKAALAPPDSPGSTVRAFETAAGAREVFDELRTLPFMGLAGRRVVVVEQGDAFGFVGTPIRLHIRRRTKRSHGA